MIKKIRNLDSRFQNLKNKIIKLKEEIDSKINDLEEKNNELINELSSGKEKNDDLNKKKDKLLFNDNKINKESIQKFENLSKDLTDQLKKINPIDIENNNEKMIIVNFQSVDQKINCPIICKSSSKFNNVITDFLMKCPEYAENDGDDLLFMGNGKKMIKMKSMKENGFNDYNILIYKKDN